jgi:hypothetical protein
MIIKLPSQLFNSSVRLPTLLIETGFHLSLEMRIYLPDSQRDTCTLFFVKSRKLVESKRVKASYSFALWDLFHIRLGGRDHIFDFLANEENAMPIHRSNAKLSHISRSVVRSALVISTRSLLDTS